MYTHLTIWFVLLPYKIGHEPDSHFKNRINTFPFVNVIVKKTIL